VLLPEDEIRDVILHEIAHALAGHKAGHGPVWKAAARKVGAKPSRCAAPSARPPAPIEGRCPKCDVKVSEHHRMPRAKYVHRTCRTLLTYVRL
jgi:predicted SprT family Zn-dependent metalloprotease